MRRTHLVACAAIASTLAAAPAAIAKPEEINSSRLERMVTVEGITEHQKALQNIADMNGGTRYTRTAGFTASAAHANATLEKAGYNDRYEMFNMPIWREDAAPVLQQTSPNAKTYRPGSRDDDNTPDV